MNYSAKGQSGIELLALTCFAMMIFSGFYLSVMNKNISVAQENIRHKSEEIAKKVAFEINTAVTEGGGYSKNFTISQDIYGIEYNITVLDGMVIIEYKNTSIISNIIIKNISGEISSGKNLVYNINGIVYAREWT